MRAAHPDLPPDTGTGDVVGVTGRVIFLRNTGKLCFATLRRATAPSCRRCSAWPWSARRSSPRWKADVDLGDHVFVHGEVIDLPAR